MKLRKLLVIDNDFESYDTPNALNSAIEKLKKKKINWSYNIGRQGFYLSALKKDEYDALIVDNDFGEGLETAFLIRRKYKKIPILYISVYDMEGLRMEYDYLAERKMIGDRPILGLVNPDIFKSVGVTYL